jgi:O-antigen ligase
MTESASEQPCPSPSGRAPLATVGGLSLGVAAAATLLLLVFLTLGRSVPAGFLARSPASAFLLLAMMAIGLPVFALATLRWPDLVVCTLIFACVLFNQTIERVYLPLGFFRIYPQDILLGGAIAVALLRARSAAPVRWTATALGKWIGIAIIFASVQAIRGVSLGNDLNSAFGDLRRGYFYMVVYYLVLAESSDPRRLQRFHRAFLLGSLAIMARGFHRLIFGRFFQMSWFDVFHLLGHSDLLFVTFLSYYCLTRVVFPAPGRQRWPWAALFPITLVLILLGNFRANWLGFLLAALVITVLLPPRKRRRVVLAAIPVMLGAGLVFYACRNVRIGQFGETVQETVGAKFRSLLDYQTDPNVIWRFHSYQAGWRIWSEHPWFGAGLGRKLVFHSINASGQQIVQFEHRAHNSFLWIGFTTGVAGLVIFLALHGTYFLGAVRRARALGDCPETGLILAYLAFYVGLMTVAFFDVFLEESATAIVLYFHMAIVRRLGETAVRGDTSQP